MTLRFRRRASVRAACFAFALGAIFAPASAHAFCRTITAPIVEPYDPDQGCYVPPADTASIPLWWRNACVGFSVQQNASAKIPWATADTVAQSAFARWSASSCGDGAPSIQPQDEGPVACDNVQYSQIGPNQHTILFRDTTWPHTDAYNTLALTTVTFDTETGEILDADMEINTHQHSIVTKTPVPAGSYDLESILTHEAGHFLGLAHSPATSAVMYWKYQPGSTTLTHDDVGGICSIYLPNGDRVTDQNQGGKVSAISVPQTACDATPKEGFGSACGPLGAPASSGGCTIAAAAGFGGAGATPRNAILLGVILLALAIARRRATLFGMRRLNGVRAIVTCSLLALGGATLAGIAAEREAQASVVITVLFDELVRDSTGAALVTPMEQRSVWENGRIYTFTRVHVDRSVAGAVENDPWVRTMGGVVGKIGQLVDGEPVLTVGRPGLLFMQPLAEEGPGVYVVTARAQGQFPIVLDAQKTQRFVRASGVGAEVPTPRERVVQISRSRAMSGMASGAPLATDVLHKRPIEDGVRDVTAAWTRIHGAR